MGHDDLARIIARKRPLDHVAVHIEHVAPRPALDAVHAHAGGKRVNAVRSDQQVVHTVGARDDAVHQRARAGFGIDRLGRLDRIHGLAFAEQGLDIHPGLLAREPHAVDVDQRVRAPARMGDRDRAVRIARPGVVRGLAVVIGLAVLVCHPDQRVIAPAAVERGGVRRVGQRVGAVRAVLHAKGIHVRAAIVAAARRNRVVHAVPARLAAEPQAVDSGQRVRAVLRVAHRDRAVGVARERVVRQRAVIVDLVIATRTAIHDVVAAPAIEDIVAVCARQHIVLIVADDHAVRVDLAVHIARNRQRVLDGIPLLLAMEPQAFNAEQRVRAETRVEDRDRAVVVERQLVVGEPPGIVHLVVLRGGPAEGLVPVGVVENGHVHTSLTTRRAGMAQAGGVSGKLRAKGKSTHGEWSPARACFS